MTLEEYIIEVSELLELEGFNITPLGGKDLEKAEELFNLDFPPAAAVYELMNEEDDDN